jgi:hypothetical protein
VFVTSSALSWLRLKLPEITTLLGVKTGKYEIVTYSGTHHILDLDRNTVTRYGAPGHEWSSDGQPFHYLYIKDVEVGKGMYMESGSGGYLQGSQWRQSSAIQTIERIEE